MVSELATNCIRHAEAEFEVTIESHRNEVRVEVSDDAGGTPTKRSPAPEEPRGRGLQIVEMFSDALGGRAGARRRQDGVVRGRSPGDRLDCLSDGFGFGSAQPRRAASVRPLSTDSGRSATTSEPGRASWSRRLISSH